ncbi:MAG: SMP-30/gluconolactonase/LRE family protein [Bosea sp.]|uniref:SMP-30/gluconolactonase/LRE family protein n=1 Tax=Bosea sp. (in: a-proteobacteria) TaxID=1871050 RepID=UPI001AC2C539|nr:SMP-30/gluconolactonase/LRE family protein [Bosea sp. (in: a-proteobacteria)]MBN9450720.1 SMP-30/gluconolactonase/LRE family protein [Bosea sp. (in: a-proteobacteria)]
MFGLLEGTGVTVLDPRFHGVIPGSARVERLWTGARWSEGPAWFPAHNTLIWSDIPNDRMLRYDALSGQVGTFRQPARHSNGNTVDAQGRLVTCEHSGRQVTRTEHDGSITVLASHFGGRRLNSPNDAVVKSDGSIWFTDPDYGILSDYEGDKSPSEIGACHVYRIDGRTGEIAVVADDFVKPNGLAFSPDESILYIADTGGSHDPENGPRHIRSFRMGRDGITLGASKVFATCTAGLFDGFRLDIEGRIWTSAADGVHVYHPDGTLIGKVAIPEIVANVCWGGPKLNRLFICGTTSLYSVMTHTNGAQHPG